VTVLREVVERLRGALDRSPSGAVREAHTRVVDGVTPAFVELTKGTANQDLFAAQAALRTVAGSFERVDELLTSTRESTGAWLAEHGERTELPPPQDPICRLRSDQVTSPHV